MTVVAVIMKVLGRIQEKKIVKEIGTVRDPRLIDIVQSTALLRSVRILRIVQEI